MVARSLAVALALAAIAGCTKPLTEQEKRDRDLATPVKGFVDSKAVDGSRLAMTTVEYFGGFTTRIEIEGGKATVTKSSMLAPDGAKNERTQTYTLTPADLDALSDVMNLIVRDEMWKQGDVKTEGVADGGEQSYEFKIGDHEGKFRLINSSPEHLYVFRSKAAYLMNALEARASGTVPKK